MLHERSDLKSKSKSITATLPYPAVPSPTLPSQYIAWGHRSNHLTCCFQYLALEAAREALQAEADLTCEPQDHALGEAAVSGRP